MLVKEKEIILYRDNKNKIPFNEWKYNLQKVEQIIVNKRLERIRTGNYGDYKSVGDGILELRFSQGYRIYFTEINNIIVLLLCGGDKSSQQKDIERAKEYKKILEERGINECIK